MKKEMALTKRNLLYALLGSSLFWNTPLLVHAAVQTDEPMVTANIPTDHREFTLEEVQVTANREYPANLSPAYSGGQVARGNQMGTLGNKDFMDTPFNVTGYTSELMENQQSHTIADVVANDPSVRSSAYYAYKESFFIRGLELNSQDIGFNGLYGIVPLNMIGTDFAERIEVFKGPSALLNGMSPNGSVGGSINLVPKRAGEKPMNKLTTGYYGGLMGGHLDIGHRFGEDKRFGVRFNGTYRNGDTRIDHQSQEMGSTVLGLDYRKDRFRASVDLGYQQSNMNAPGTSLYLNSGLSVPRVPKNTTNLSFPWSYVNNKDTFGVFHSEFDLNQNWTAFASAGARKNRFEFLQGYPTLENEQGDTTNRIMNYPSKTTANTGELGIRGNFTTGPIKHQLALSGTRYHQQFDYAVTEASGLSNIYHPALIAEPYLSPGHLRKSSETTLSGLALVDTLSTPDDRLQLILGARRQQVEVDNFNYNTGVKKSSYNKSATTPAVGLVIKAKSNLSFYGNYIEGLQQGSTAPTGTVNAGEVFVPFKSKQHEIGIKMDGGLYATTLSAFQIKKPSGLTDPSTLIYSIDGQQRHRGLELNIFGEPVRGTRVLGGVMMLDGKMISTANGIYDGNRPVGVPRWTAAMGVEWDTPFQPNLTLTARAIYNGSQYVDSGNTQRLSPWTRFDVGARYTFQQKGAPVTLRATVTNVLNKRYWAGTSGAWINIGAPRTLLLSATMEL